MKSATSTTGVPASGIALPSSSATLSSLILLLLLVAGPLQRSALGQSIDGATVTIWDHVPWSATFGTAFNDDEFQGGVEVLAPLWVSGDGNNLIFLYPEFGAYDAGRQSYSVGVGIRSYLESLNAIVGFNAFYDHTESGYDFGYDQLGLGIEIKTEKVDANLNWYFPESDQNVIATRMTGVASGGTTGTPFAAGNAVVAPFSSATTMMEFRRFEAGLQGFDGEVGVKIPVPCKLAEFRAYAGGFTYRNPFGSNIEGFKSRLEARFNDLVTADVAYYGDGRLVDGHWLFGLRVSIPLGKTAGPLAVGGTGGGAGSEAPLYTGSGAPRGTDVRGRLGENIQRMNRVITTESDWISNPANCVVMTTDGLIVLVPDISFVNNTGAATGNGILAAPEEGLQNGTAEAPFDTIDEGATASGMQSTATGRTWIVYTQGGGPAYNEIPTGGNVNIVGSTRFLASGTGIPLPPIAGGMTFGTGEGLMPVLNGGFGGVNDTFPINFVQVQGYGINGGRTQPVMDAFLSADGGHGEGIFLEHVPVISITDNIIDGLGGGPIAPSPEAPASEAPESLAAVDSNGIQIVSDGDFTATIANNISSNWGRFDFVDSEESPEGNGGFMEGTGILIEAAGLVTATVNLAINTTSNNGQDGIRLRSFPFDENGGGGGAIIQGGDLVATLTGNTASFNGRFGVSVDSAGKLTLVAIDNTTNENRGDGFSTVMNGTGDMMGAFNKNTSNDNGDDGFDVDIFGGNFLVDVVDNTALRNDDKGFTLFNPSTGGSAMSNVTGNNFSLNGNDGFNAELDRDFTGFFSGNTFNGNGDDGSEIDVGLGGTGTWTGDVTFNTANDNMDSGLYFDVGGGTTFHGDVLDNTTLRNVRGTPDMDFDEAGISIEVAGPFIGTVANNTSTDNGTIPDQGEGISLIFGNGSNISVLNNTLSNNRNGMNREFLGGLTSGTGTISLGGNTSTNTLGDGPPFNFEFFGIMPNDLGGNTGTFGQGMIAP